MAQRADELASASEQPEVKNAKGSTKWEHLPFEMKEMIVKEMGIDTRTCLKMCSTSDKYLVESLPYKFAYFAAFWHEKGYEGDGLNGGCNQWCNPVDSNRYHHYFILDNMHISQYLNKVTIIKYSTKRPTYTNNQEVVKKRVIELGSEEEAEKMIEGFFYSILYAKNHRHEFLSTEWVFKTNHINNGLFTNLEMIGIYNKKRVEITDWLKKLPPGMQRIFVQSDIKLIGVGELENILTTFNVTFKNTDINDEQFLNFQTKELKLEKAKVTPVGVNKMIKKFIGEDYAPESVFTVHLPANDQNVVQVLDGIEIQKYEMHPKIEDDENVLHYTIAMTHPKILNLYVVLKGNFLKIRVKVDDLEEKKKEIERIRAQYAIPEGVDIQIF